MCKVEGSFKPPKTLQDCTTQYNDVKKALRAAEKDEQETGKRRQTHLEQRAEALSLQGDTSKSKIVRHLQQAEETHQVFQKCAHARGKLIQSGLDHIKIPQNPGDNPKSENTTWVQVDCPKEIEQHITDRNVKHFGQAQGTPWTVPPLSHEVNFQASTLVSDAAPIKL